MSLLQVYYGYAEEDQALVGELDKHLAPLRRQELIQTWDRHDALPGTDQAVWSEEKLNRADIILLFISSSFLASPTCSMVVERAMQRHAVRAAQVIPVLLLPCRWQQEKLSRLKPLPRSELPVKKWRDRNEGWLDVVSGLMLVIGELSRVHVERSLPPEIVARRILASLEISRATFQIQCKLRDQLRLDMVDRLAIQDWRQHEEFFVSHYGAMTQEERFQFEAIRRMTEKLREENQAVLDMLAASPTLLDSVHRLAALREHLERWLRKYQDDFVSTPERCLCYTGVSEGYPFPAGIEGELEVWIASRGATPQRSEP